MNVALAVIAGVTVAGAVLAVSARDVRATVLGILVVLLAAPLVASPWPGPVPILARVAAALLAARLLTIGLRGATIGAGSRIGWPTEALAAAAASVIGFGSHGLGSPGLGPAEAQAAGFGLIAVAMTPLVTGRDVLRLGVGSLLLVMGALLVRVGLDRPAGDGEQLVVGLLTIGLGGAVGVIAAAARAAGGLEVANRTAERRGPRPPDAHRQSPPVAPALAPATAPAAAEPPVDGGSTRTPRTPRAPRAKAPPPRAPRTTRPP
ncbi:MAG TPA: hypothetical protein VFY18_00945 [Candidatus Limnocylindrales bacterium]|nr:hypothetical protein [Candidatus Limnocylindrales bacterium]